MSTEIIAENKEAVGRGLRAMSEQPHFFLYFGDYDDWFDGYEICGVPVANCMPNRLSQHNKGDEDCKFTPMWYGELTDKRSRALDRFTEGFSGSNTRKGE